MRFIKEAKEAQQGVDSILAKKQIIGSVAVKRSLAQRMDAGISLPKYVVHFKVYTSKV